MKYPLILLFIIAATTIQAQTLSEKLAGLWKIDYLIGMSDENEYDITNRINYEENQFLYGNSIVFSADSVFDCSYSAPCGNDCFPHTSGRYTVIDDTHIRLHLDRIEVHGMCKGRDERPNIDLGKFLVETIKEGFRLIACPEGVDEDQLRVYSQMVNALPEISTGGSGLNWVKLNPRKRDTKGTKILRKGLIADGQFNPNKARLVYTKSIGWYYITAFVFEYEGQNHIGLYSAGPEIFAIYKENKTEE